ncbi:glandular kallikrein-like isoform X1 [Talpa occidentalis]|uniref:glandular kallikrein-like isoform X1 n=1 Tax=Talpa occidentalis TaxID=50954 RepID=UPI00188F7D09|nr:glandular kallikrein-like isoform X1 [Talpa occidentalis]
MGTIRHGPPPPRDLLSSPPWAAGPRGDAGAAPPVQSRIVGGWECEKHSQPWQAAIYHHGILECGGVLVHPQWVLTAARCMKSHYQVWLGRHDLLEDEHTAQFFQVTHHFPHPQFNKTLLEVRSRSPGEDYSHDLMLLRLEQPADLSGAVQVLELPTQEPHLWSACYVSGWGSLHPAETEKIPNRLHCVDLALLPTQLCQSVFMDKVTDVMLCAGRLKGGKDACKGDSGSPLVCGGVLHGIMSWGGTPCGREQVPSVYSKLLPHLQWIQSTIANYS